MKNLLVSILIAAFFYSVQAQDNRTVILENLEQGNIKDQEARSAWTATIKSATRLFGDRNDLTSVITVIPSGSEVDVLGADSTHLRVVFEEAEGFIFKRHAAIRQTPMSSRIDIAVANQPAQSAYPSQSQSQPQPQPQPQPQQSSRFSYLENKYGTNMASLLIAGKIWKGMEAEMVRDSWGKPQKINRIISGNTIKEEWIYKNSWLYIEDDVLMTWGPADK